MKSKSFELFDEIRYGELNDYDTTVLLKKYTKNYNLELLKSLEKDMSFYLFVEKEEQESKYSQEDIDSAIKKLIDSGREIPCWESPLLDNYNKENKQRPKKTIKTLNKEALLFPYEFFPVYQFSNKIKAKIKEVSAKQDKGQDIEAIDFSSTKGTEKIIMLYKLGILDYLKTQEPFNASTNALASVISGITGMPLTTVQPYINPIDNEGVEQKNNPLNTEKTVHKVLEKLLNIGFKPSK